MSFHSSLILFLPGRPPVFNLLELRPFCERVRAEVVVNDSLLQLKVRYRRLTVDPDVVWDESGTIGFHSADPLKKESWDWERQRLPWANLWPNPQRQLQELDRVAIDLGGLPQSLTQELSASDTTSKTPSYIAPTELSLYLGPVVPMTLAGDLPENESDCFGGIQLKFGGMGYFTWQPLTSYWSFAKEGRCLQRALQICREIYPARATVDPDIYKERLGELFLNQEDYRTGDWIASVSEYG